MLNSQEKLFKKMLKKYGGNRVLEWNSYAKTNMENYCNYELDMQSQVLEGYNDLFFKTRDILTLGVTGGLGVVLGMFVNAGFFIAMPVLYIFSIPAVLCLRARRQFEPYYNCLNRCRTIIASKEYGKEKAQEFIRKTVVSEYEKIVKHGSAKKLKKFIENNQDVLLLSEPTPEKNVQNIINEFKIDNKSQGTSKTYSQIAEKSKQNDELTK